MQHATRLYAKPVFSLVFFTTCFCLLMNRQVVAEETQIALANNIISETGVTGGLIVHFGCGDGKLTARLKVNDSYQVHGLDANRSHVETARTVKGDKVQQLLSYQFVYPDLLSWL